MRLSIACALAASILSSAGARAQDPIADFYRGKQVTLVVGSSSGGGYDLYARLVARFMSKHIPGNPNVVVQNMPGAGGNTSAAYVANVAAKDGSVIGAPQAGSLVDQLVSVNAAQIKHDARTLNYIGSANSEVFTCLVKSDSPIKTFDDIFTREVIFGSSGGTTRDMPMALKNLLGAKIRFVQGYAGTREVGMAMETGEVQGLCGMGWTSIQSQRPDWFEKKIVRVLVQESMVGDPARANMLTALLDGVALTATELTLEAGVTKQTASSHLAKLEDAGLVAVEAQGRHRYYRLASPDVAIMLESMMFSLIIAKIARV
jgi:DNA-binding transcriptional ArsR family regulator